MDVVLVQRLGWAETISGACVESNAGPFPRLPHTAVVVSAFDEDVRWLTELAKDAHSVSLYIHTDGVDKDAVRSHCCTTRGCDTSSKCPQDSSFAKHQKLLKLAPQLATQHNNIHHYIIPNRGDEAAAFFKYILTHYDDLAPYTAFVHGHRTDYHAADMLDVLRHMCLTPSTHFANLNVWPDGRPHLIQCYSQHPSSSIHAKHFHSDLAKRHASVATLEREVFGHTAVRPFVLAHAYAQFIVSRDAIRRHPVSVYATLLDRVLRTNDGFEAEAYYRQLFIGGQATNNPATDIAIAARRC